MTTLPDVRELWLSTRDFFVVVGTAGLWEVFPPQEVAEWLWKYAQLAGRDVDLSQALCTEAEVRARSKQQLSQPANLRSALSAACP